MFMNILDTYSTHFLRQFVLHIHFHKLRLHNLDMVLGVLLLSICGNLGIHFLKLLISFRAHNIPLDTRNHLHILVSVDIEDTLGIHLRGKFVQIRTNKSHDRGTISLDIQDVFLEKQIHPKKRSEITKIKLRIQILKNMC